MVSFSISFWDLIKFPYFAGTTKRGDRRWKQAQRQGDVMTHTIDRKILQLKICHPFKKKQNPNLYTWEEGPVWASLWIDGSVCSWCLGKRPILCFLVLGNWGALTLFPDTLKHGTASRLGPSLRGSKQSLAMRKFTYEWGDGWMDGWQDRWMKWCFTTSFTICNEEEVQARSPMLNKNSCWVVSSLTWSLNQCWASIEFLLITIVVVDSSILEIFKSQKHPVPVLWGKLDLIRRNEKQRKNCWFRLFQKPQRKT